MSRNPLHLLMNPKSIAWIGASNNPQKMGSIQAFNLLQNGYKGNFYPIHPKDEFVLGYKAYMTPESLPEVPDLAVLTVRKELVAQLLELFGQIGTRRAIIITAGFKETGAQGQRDEDELNRIAHKYNMRFIGPNCIGVINAQISMNTTLRQYSLGPGPLGFASQSGTYVTQTYQYLARNGIRLSKAMSLGNEANITLTDALEYLGEDEGTKAIILYIEGIREGRLFIDMAKRITPHKPILALYVGGSDAGARSGMSHTGALAGPDYLYDGIFKQAGIIRVNTIEELLQHGWAFAVQPPMKGNRIGIVSNSGGPASSISNMANINGLDLPVFSDTLQSEIRKYISDHAVSSNPVDLTFNLDMGLLSTDLPEIILKSDEADGLIVHGIIDLGEQTPTDLSKAVELPNVYKKPYLISSFYDRTDRYVAYYQDNDIPVYDAPEKAAQVMANLNRYRIIRERKSSSIPNLPETSKEASILITRALNRGQKALDEYEGKRLLAAYGLPVAREKLVSSEYEAIQATAYTGYPVALKGCAWDIMHKTDKGLVHLNLMTEMDVVKAFQAIRSSAGKDISILVQEMIPSSREFMMGLTHFPGFGPVLLFGLGGIFAEVLNDTVFRSAPLSKPDAINMICDIRSAGLLGDYRGMPAVNINALSEIMQKLGFMAMLHPEISEMDINPIMIKGSNPIIADALLLIK